MGESSGGDLQDFKYNGKELDRWHGLDWYDYGARMYDGTIGKFSTIDPLCEKNHNITPYHYCHNNPWNRIDPNGQDDYMLNRDGHLKFLKSTDDDNHTVFAQNEDGSIKEGTNIIVSKSFVNSKVTNTYSGRRNSDVDKSVSTYSVDFYSSTDEQESTTFFEFAANNTDVEWSNTDISSSNGDFNIVATSHNESSELGQRAIIDGAYGCDYTNSHINYAYHSHLPTSVGLSYGDIKFANDAIAKNPNIVLKIYNRVSYQRFDKDDIPGTLSEVFVNGKSKK